MSYVENELAATHNGAAFSAGTANTQYMTVTWDGQRHHVTTSSKPSGGRTDNDITEADLKAMKAEQAENRKKKDVATTGGVGLEKALLRVVLDGDALLRVMPLVGPEYLEQQAREREVVEQARELNRRLNRRVNESLLSPPVRVEGTSPELRTRLTQELQRGAFELARQVSPNHPRWGEFIRMQREIQRLMQQEREAQANARERSVEEMRRVRALRELNLFPSFIRTTVGDPFMEPRLGGRGLMEWPREEFDEMIARLGGRSG